MLTSAFYYELYRPYILGSRGRNNKDIIRRRTRIAETTPQEKLEQGMVIVLNKSLKEEIVNYARNVSQGVTHFKSAIRLALADMGSFGLNAMYNGYDSAVRLVELDLIQLTEAYNKSTAFLESQQQSSELNHFSAALKDRVYQGRDRLGLLGFAFSLYDDEEWDGILVYDPEILRSLSQIEIHAAIGANMQVFHSLHQTTTEVLNAPLSSHMHFKGLNYHYNYQLGRMVEDGFGIIESGMIVDRVL